MIERDRIGIQLYDFETDIRGDSLVPSVREQQANVVRVFETLREIGYTRFENFGGTWGWSAAEYRRVFESYGLRAIGDHGALDPATWSARLDQSEELGLEAVGSGGWPAPGLDTVEHALETAATLNELGEQALARGMQVYGHNHDHELATRLAYDVDSDGTPESVTALEVAILNTDPRSVTFELDVHWAYEGLGHDRFDELLDLIGTYSDRIGLLHVKGTAADGSISDVGEPSDITDWPAVFRAARHVRHYVFEYDFARSPTASAAIGYAFLVGFDA